MSELHRLLVRQLKRARLTEGTAPDAAAFGELLQAVSRAYTAADEDRYTIERSLELSSKEMESLYAQLTEKHARLENELQIAVSLQTSLLPREVAPPYLQIGARMVPATEAGGDYYDVIPVEGGCWIAIGDVTGHGLRAAVIMLMVQSMVATLTRAMPAASPSFILGRVNDALATGLRDRLGVDDHVTCTLLFVTPAGHVTYAGAHEDILVLRAAGGCERIETPGTWLGLPGDYEAKSPASTFQLAPGDTIVLYSDGITEARNVARKQFTLDRLEATVLRDVARGVDDMCDGVFREVGAWASGAPADDLTVVIARYSRTTS